MKRKNTRAAYLGESGHGKISGQFVVCLSNKAHPASLELHKIYIVVRDTAAAKLGLLRVIDESGEDYLYPKSLFRPIVLPQAITRVLFSN